MVCATAGRVQVGPRALAGMDSDWARYRHCAPVSGGRGHGPRPSVVGRTAVTAPSSESLSVAVTSDRLGCASTQVRAACGRLPSPKRCSDSFAAPMISPGRPGCTASSSPYLWLGLGQRESDLLIVGRQPCARAAAGRCWLRERRNAARAHELHSGNAGLACGRDSTYA